MPESRHARREVDSRQGQGLPCRSSITHHAVDQQWIAVLGVPQGTMGFSEEPLDVFTPNVAKCGVGASCRTMAAATVQAAADVQAGGEVAQFLMEIGLQRYTQALVQSGFDEMETLVEIEEEDLRDIGIPRGHIIKLRKRLRDYTGGSGLQESPELQRKARPAPQLQLCSPPTSSNDFAPELLADCSPSLQVQGRAAAAGRAPESPKSCRAISSLPTGKMATAVERSWQQLRVLGTDRIGELLFQDFFETVPEAQDLFPPEVRSKYKEWTDADAEDIDLRSSPSLKNLSSKVVSAIGYAVIGLNDLERLVPKLRELGARHFGYGMSERHLKPMGKSLMRVLRRCLGDAFTPEVEFAWSMVYSFMQAIMHGGWNESKVAVVAPARHSFPTPAQVSEECSRSSPRLALATEETLEPEVPQSEEMGEGCEISGGLEIYRIDQHLQKAIFGDVFSAVGLSTGRRFAIKVLDRDMVQRFERLQLEDVQFCESPLNEVRFTEVMRGLDNVVQLEDHFSNDESHFIVSKLAIGGDLLDALRLQPGGFPEQQARLFVRGAAIGLASLHQRCLAMQDVSLENMLLYIAGNGDESVHVCDPGQACQFVVDPVTGEEIPSDFRGFVAKEFRAPELYDKKEYLATKVDAWCLGWSAFYLLCAQPLFHSADPEEADPDWILFQTRPSRLFASKGLRPEISAQAQDFILQLMHLDPEQRLSVRDALRHPWLAEAGAAGAACRSKGGMAMDDDLQSAHSSVGSRATTAAPTPKLSERAGFEAVSPAPAPQGHKVQALQSQVLLGYSTGGMAPTLLQHGSSQHFKKPLLPIPAKEGNVPSGGRRPAGPVGGMRAFSN